ncbi:MAG: ABC transporter permease [Clostridiaceae bacterium]|nr:ABC transporter permease [Clostridiaceae bacterium]
MNRKRLKENWRNFWRNKSCAVGLIMILILVGVALCDDLIAPFGYNEADLSARYAAPSAAHLFGTDDYGRDVFSRTVYGTGLALRSALLGAMIEMAIGVTLGLVAGFFGKWIDSAITFIADMIWSLPTVVIAMAIVMFLGKSLDNVIIACALAGWPRYTRIVRAKTMSIKNQPYVETGVAFGESKAALMFLYIFPNILPSMLVMASISMPGFIGSTTTLSFLGMGAQPPSPDWGLAISRGASVIYRAAWVTIFPCIALMYTIIAFSLFGEGLRDLIDPRLQTL